MKLSKIMSPNPVSVFRDDYLAEIKELFESSRFHHLLVVERKSRMLVGVISDRDLLKTLSPYLDTPAETVRDRYALNMRAHQIMSRKLRTLTPEHDVFDAVSLFNAEKISCIPILDEGNRPAGIVSWRDIMSVLDRHYRSKSSR